MDSEPAARAGKGHQRASLRRLLHGAAHANLFVALGLAANTWLVQVLAGVPAGPLPPLTSGLAFFAVYAFDRLAEPEADAVTHPERARFWRQHRRPLTVLAAVACAGSLALAWRLGPATLAVALLPFVAILTYSFRWMSRSTARRVGFSRLKELFFVKNLGSAVTLATTVTLLPLSARAPGAWPPVVGVWSFLVGRYGLNTVVFDMRDEPGDARHAVRTFPVVLGRRRTFRLLHVLNLALGLYALALPALGWAPPAFAVLALGSVYAFVYLRRAERPGDLHFLCDVVVDGELLVLSAAVLLALGV